MTAVVVTEMSAGGSLRATVEYMIGTFGGAVYAAIIGLLIPHTSAIAQGGVLALTIAPLALAAALNPNFRVAPFSAVLVLLISGQLSEGPIESALYRVAEVALGGVIAVTVSLLVLPERAHHLVLEAAARVLEWLAHVLPVLLAGFIRYLDPTVIRRVQDDIGETVSSFQGIVAEAKRERLVSIVAEPDPGPLSRTLRRLRHDLVIIGRAAVVPLPDILAQRLGPTLTRLGANASNFLHGCATALALRVIRRHSMAWK
jgi:Fusaric acid resistance protein-like